jgi:hypothetical protein
LAAPPALTSKSAGRSRESRDQPSGRATENGLALAVVKLSRVLEVT